HDVGLDLVAVSARVVRSAVPIETQPVGRFSHLNNEPLRGSWYRTIAASVLEARGEEIKGNGAVRTIRLVSRDRITLLMDCLFAHQSLQPRKRRFWCFSRFIIRDVRDRLPARIQMRVDGAPCPCLMSRTLVKFAPLPASD